MEIEKHMCDHDRCYSEQTMAAVVKERESLRIANTQLLEVCRRWIAVYEQDPHTTKYDRETHSMTCALIAAAEGCAE